MTLRGHVENGQIVLDEPGDLPHGALVRIELIDASPEAEIHPDVRRISGILPIDASQGEYYEALAKKHQ